jgi:LysR family hydrogen peroxide-inducible transcriptional activator
VTTLRSLKQLQYLVALADELSFTRAAAACFVTQSTLSAGLRELETLLGAQLVERDRKTVLMTPLGLEIARRARPLLAAADDIVALAADTATPMTGVLRLGVIPTIAPFLLPHAMQQLRQRFPKLRLALREDLTANLITRLEGGHLDLILFALPVDTGNLLVQPLFDDELLLVGQKSDVQMQARTVRISALQMDQLLLLEEGHCLRDHALYACGAQSHASPAGVEATSLLTLVQMIESGFGVGLVPQMAVSNGLLGKGRLVARPMAAPKPTRTIALAARRSSNRLADMKLLAEVVKSAGKARRTRKG